RAIAACRTSTRRRPSHVESELRSMAVIAISDVRPADSHAKPFIEMNDVTMSYGGQSSVIALQHFTFRVRRGEFAAIGGPSGCGKSTFLKLASGLRAPSAGDVLVAERRVTGPLKFVGMAFQNTALLPWRTCLQNVMLPFEIVQPFKSRQRQDYGEHH